MIFQINYLQQSFNYVTSVPYFWQSMGMIVSISMILSVLLFDHNLKLVIRSAFTKLIFIFTLLLVTYQRLENSIKIGVTDLEKNAATPLASLITIIIISFFWFVGIVLAILIISYQKRRYKIS